MSKVFVQIQIEESLYVRDPQSTKVGLKIIHESINLFDKHGLENFTFKKLAQKIKSVEGTIYRYFENKHKLLSYLVNLYWEWLRFCIDFNTNNINSPVKKLQIVILTISNFGKQNEEISFFDQSALQRIVISEGMKAYHTKEVDTNNKEGFFLSYKSLCEQIAAIILEIQPGFPYPRSLASNILEMTNNHIFFSQHLPRLTDVKMKAENYQPVYNLMEFFAFKLLDVELSNQVNGYSMKLKEEKKIMNGK